MTMIPVTNPVVLKVLNDLAGPHPSALVLVPLPDYRNRFDCYARMARTSEAYARTDGTWLEVPETDLSAFEGTRITIERSDFEALIGANEERAKALEAIREATEQAIAALERKE